MSHPFKGGGSVADRLEAIWDPLTTIAACLQTITHFLINACDDGIGAGELPGLAYLVESQGRSTQQVAEQIEGLMADLRRRYMRQRSRGSPSPRSREKDPGTHPKAGGHGRTPPSGGEPRGTRLQQEQRTNPGRARRPFSGSEGCFLRIVDRV